MTGPGRGFAAADVVNQITPADSSDPAELIARAQDLSAEPGTSIAPGFEALVCKASRGLEDSPELTDIRRAGSRFAVGFVRHLTKPIKVKEFRETLDEVLEFVEKQPRLAADQSGAERAIQAVGKR